MTPAESKQVSTASHERNSWVCKATISAVIPSVTLQSGQHLGKTNTSSYNLCTDISDWRCRPWCPCEVPAPLENIPDLVECHSCSILWSHNTSPNLEQSNSIFGGNPTLQKFQVKNFQEPIAQEAQECLLDGMFIDFRFSTFHNKACFHIVQNPQLHICASQRHDRSEGSVQDFVDELNEARKLQSLVWQRLLYFQSYPDQELTQNWHRPACSSLMYLMSLFAEVSWAKADEHVLAMRSAPLVGWTFLWWAIFFSSPVTRNRDLNNHRLTSMSWIMSGPMT